jgi:hypothetical protein
MFTQVSEEGKKGATRQRDTIVACERTITITLILIAQQIMKHDAKSLSLSLFKRTHFTNISSRTADLIHTYPLL